MALLASISIALLYFSNASFRIFLASLARYLLFYVCLLFLIQVVSSLLITDFSAISKRFMPLSKLFLQISSSTYNSYEDSRHCKATSRLSFSRFSCFNSSRKNLSIAKISVRFPSNDILLSISKKVFSDFRRIKVLKVWYYSTNRVKYKASITLIKMNE